MKYLKKFEHMNDFPDVFRDEIMVNSEYDQQKRASQFLDDIFELGNPRKRKYIKAVLMGASTNKLDSIIDDLPSDSARWYETLARDLGIPSHMVAELEHEPMYKTIDLVHTYIKKAFKLTPKAISTNRFDL